MPITAVPAHLTFARQCVGKYRDGADVPALAGHIADRYPEMRQYASEATGSTAWCGIFVAFVLTSCGIRPVFGSSDTERFMWADAWRRGDWRATSVSEPQPGDVAVWRWESGQEHVSFIDRVEGNVYYSLGGNQSDGVSVAAFPRRNCIALLRPPAAQRAAASEPEWESGRGSWYSQYEGRYSWRDSGDQPGSNALPGLQRSAAFTQPLLHERPGATPWCAADPGPSVTADCVQLHPRHARA